MLAGDLGENALDIKSEYPAGLRLKLSASFIGIYKLPQKLRVCVKLGEKNSMGLE
ncbi:hypothetical protein GCM10010909_21540 [Acidocella aquatica]|uniref:Uncharacterized protein n=1 Tax=Acidocella aquatica TaxID=1922313 RepID=A0ABQ6AB73_9PROT|nr:hypothetical protein GCM10010909_21540 [Acidocella aquatica]